MTVIVGVTGVGLTLSLNFEILKKYILVVSVHAHMHLYVEEIYFYIFECQQIIGLTLSLKFEK